MIAESMLTTRQVAELLGLVPNTVKRLGNRGELKYYRVCSRGDRRYYPSDVMDYLEKTSAKTKF